LGFTRLAQHDYPAATQAFTAAGIWAGVGGAAAIAGRAIAPSQSSGSAGAAGSSAGDGGAGSASVGASSGQAVTAVHVYVQGHVVGWTNIDELTAAINDAVLNRDTYLTATNTKTGVQVVR
jgi:hypothetical protein